MNETQSRRLIEKCLKQDGRLLGETITLDDVITVKKCRLYTNGNEPCKYCFQTEGHNLCSYDIENYHEIRDI